MIVHTFNPPVQHDGPLFTNDPLGRYYTLQRGVTVLKNQDGTYTTKVSPTQDELAAAAFAYRGGYVYTLTDAEVTALTAAGFGAYIESKDWS